jgi:microcystin degradation protein MlrC
VRIILGAIIQETNTFSPAPGTLDQFRTVFYLKGDEIPQRLSDSSVEISGMYEVLGPLGHTLVPTVAAMATSGGRLSRRTYETLRDDLLRPVRSGAKADAVLLALHGAMSTEDEDDGDGALLAELRNVVGPECPVFVTHDLHANLTQKRVVLCDALVGYHTAPHVDHRQTGARAARLLLRTLTSGKRPQNFLRKIPMLAPSVKQNTSIPPLALIIRRAQALEKNDLTPSISCFWMQPWLDVNEAGAAVNVVCYGNEHDAQPILDELGEQIWQTRHELDLNLWKVEAAIRDVRRKQGRPFVFADTGDAPSGGAPGDSNYLLQAFVDAGMDDLALLTLLDANAARQMHAAGTGALLTLQLGGSVDSINFAPKQYRGRVGRLSVGRFCYEGPIARGQEAEIGLSGIFQIGPIHVLVHEKPAFSHDPAIFKAFGYDVRQAKIVVAKSPTQFRACYEPIAAGIYEIETPGICTVNLRDLKFTRIPRPMFPFEPDEVVERTLHFFRS